jgi:Holliday junction resolvase
MTNVRSKGYRTERKIRLVLEGNGWKVVRAGASLGEADLICIRRGVCVFLQIKSTKKKAFYYYDYMKKNLEGIPFFLVVDFGYGKIRVLHPQAKVKTDDGIGLEKFLKKINKKQI